MNISFFIRLSLLLKVELIVLDSFSEGNFLGSVCIVFQYINSLNEDSGGEAKVKECVIYLSTTRPDLFRALTTADSGSN